MTARVSMLLKSRASPDVLPFSLCNKKRLAIRHTNRPLFPTTLSIASYDIGNQVGLRTYQHSRVFCRDFSKEFTRYFFWRFALNNIDLISPITRQIFSKYFQCLTVNNSIFCRPCQMDILEFSRTPRFELSRKFVGNFTVTFLKLYHAIQVIWLDILSGISRSINSIFCLGCQDIIHRKFV